MFQFLPPIRLAALVVAMLTLSGCGDLLEKKYEDSSVTKVVTLKTKDGKEVKVTLNSHGNRTIYRYGIAELPFIEGETENSGYVITYYNYTLDGKDYSDAIYKSLWSYSFSPVDLETAIAQHIEEVKNQLAAIFEQHVGEAAPSDINEQMDQAIGDIVNEINDSMTQQQNNISDNASEMNMEDCGSFCL
jgi:hypothetical protein